MAAAALGITCPASSTSKSTPGRGDTLRTMYGHWTVQIRRSKNGILLKPDVDLDGDLVGVVLPRRSPVPMLVGRGYLAQNGEVELVQVATSGPTLLDGRG